MTDSIKIENLFIDKKLDIDSEEHTVSLLLPQEKELNSAHFTVLIDEGKKKLISEINTIGGKTDIPVNQVSWIVADFKKEVKIDSLSIEFTEEEVSLKLRIKVFTNKAWTILMPMDIFPVTGSKMDLNFTPVEASKIMIEFIKENEKTAGLMEPVNVKVTSIDVFSSLFDLTLAIDEDELFYRKGLITKGEEYNVEKFVSAVNGYRYKNSGSEEIPLNIKSRGTGSILLKISKIEFTGIINKFSDNKKETKIEVDYKEKKHIGINIKSDDKIEELEFDFKTEFSTEEISEYDPGSSTYLLCDSGHSAARLFTVENERFVGVDLLLRITKVPLECSLTLFNDEFNSPSENKNSDPLSITVDETCESGWIPFRMKESVLKPGKFWAVLKVTKGELHWCLSNGKKDNKLTMMQIRSHPWQPLNECGSVIRTVSESICDPEVKFYFLKGTKRFDLFSEDGRVEQKNFQGLYDGKEEEIKLFVESRGKGSIIFSNLKIKIK